MTKVLICCTGSVAAIKLSNIIDLLRAGGAEVKVCLTEKAKHFVPRDKVQVEVLTDDDEWSAWSQRGDPVLHIDLTKWADLILIAPLDANTLGKISSGLCDNLLTCVVRAWNPIKPLYFCPAMNTQMWNHPITAAQIATLKNWGYKEIPCVSKTLMCGDTGLGAMAEPETIADIVITALK